MLLKKKVWFLWYVLLKNESFINYKLCYKNGLKIIFIIYKCFYLILKTNKLNPNIFPIILNSSSCKDLQDVELGEMLWLFLNHFTLFTMYTMYYDQFAIQINYNFRSNLNLLFMNMYKKIILKLKINWYRIILRS